MDTGLTERRIALTEAAARLILQFRHTLYRVAIAVSLHITVLGLLLALQGCQGPGAGPLGDPTSHYHARKSPDSHAGTPWVVLLPGSSGLKVFDDEYHYHRAAESLANAGYDTVIVDYKQAYRASPDAPPGETGEKIAWVTAQAIQWAAGQGHVNPEAPGAVIAWSLGGEGLWQIVADSELLARSNIKAAVAYYPSNQDERSLTAHVPLLIVSGEADDVISATELKVFVSRRDRSPGAEVELVTYPGAHHGFDISSLEKKRRLELIPVIGPKATFQYNASAAQDAQSRMLDFLLAQLRTQGTHEGRR